MADEVWVFDAAGSNVDGTNPGSPLSVGPGTNYPLLEASFPAPPLNVTYASSVDTEGEIPVARRYGNRTIPIRIAMDESGANDTLLDALQAKFAKLQREGGTLKRTRKDGSSVRIYDILAGDGWEPVYDLKYLLAHSSEVTLSLPALPLARTAENTPTDRVETTNPCLIFSETISGDDRALGRLLIDEDQAAAQQWVIWGIETDRYYTHTNSSGSGALFYEAETRTAQGGSATAAGPSGASGAGSNVMRNTALTTSYQSILSTQATGGGSHLSHVGQFDVYARFQAPATNTGTVTVGWEWAQGDFINYTLNTPFVLDPSWEGSWRIAPLGLVNIQKVPTGTQRWEGRIVAKSTVAGDDVDVDWIMLVPVDAGSGVATSLLRLNAPTSFAARDEFDQSAGTLAGKTLPVGGTWAASGAATGMTVDATNHIATRTAASNVADHFERAGATNWTDVVTTADVAAVQGAGFLVNGVFARYVDTSNYIKCVIESSGPGAIRVYKVVAGTTTQLMSYTIPEPYASQRIANEYLNLLFYVAADGRWAVYFEGTLIGAGNDSVLATGGTLATGGAGLVENNSGMIGSSIANYDNFAVWVPPRDAACYASQSIEIRHDRVLREDSGGTVWQPPSSYEGSYLRPPASGAEGRSIRVIVKMSRSIPGYGPDSATDDLSAKLFATYRYL